MRYAKKSKNMTYIRKKKGGSQEKMSLGEGLMVDLVDQEFKSTIITILR